MTFDYATILDQWDTLPTVHVYFCEGEGGWAKQLDAQHYCLANVPLADGLSLYDICTWIICDGVRMIDEVVQSYFTQKWVVRYPTDGTAQEQRARFRLLWEACKDAGGHLEGMIAGMAVCNAPATMDVHATVATCQIVGAVATPYDEDE